MTRGTTPCGQCFAYHLTVTRDGQQKTVQAVDGGTDAPADYWQVVSLINGVIPHFTPGPLGRAGPARPAPEAESWVAEWDGTEMVR